MCWVISITSNDNGLEDFEFKFNYFNYLIEVDNYVEH